jgi:hypothetical protein
VFAGTSLTVLALTLTPSCETVFALGGLLYMKKLLSILGAIVFVVVFPMLQVGCEEAEGVDGLTISPSAHSLSGDEGRKTFTAYSSGALETTNGVGSALSGLALPLVWSVSDSTLGSIVASSGITAIYERTAANGVNTITVIDQYANEGYATVSQ